MHLKRPAITDLKDSSEVGSHVVPSVDKRLVNWETEGQQRLAEKQWLWGNLLIKNTELIFKTLCLHR